MRWTWRRTHARFCLLCLILDTTSLVSFLRILTSFSHLCPLNISFRLPYNPNESFPTNSPCHSIGSLMASAEFCSGDDNFWYRRSFSTNGDPAGWDLKLDGFMGFFGPEGSAIWSTLAPLIISACCRKEYFGLFHPPERAFLVGKNGFGSEIGLSAGVFRTLTTLDPTRESSRLKNLSANFAPRKAASIVGPKWKKSEWMKFRNLGE